MARTVYLLPAYGRRYETEDAMLADWKAGKDFQISDGRPGPYCSILDLRSLKTIYWDADVMLYDRWTGIEIDLFPAVVTL